MATGSRRHGLVVVGGRATMAAMDQPVGPEGLDEVPLDGGIANAGGVSRQGDHVLRPSNPHSASVHAFLGAVAAAGFEGSSVPVGIDPDGRERLRYIEGVAPGPPYPTWARTDDALASVAALLAGLHRAAGSFSAEAHSWSPELADPEGGPIVVHNDVCLDNVIFRDGVAVGLIDFDFAAPGRPLYDLAQCARLCVPLDDRETSAMLGWEPADRPARLRLMADVYGLDADGRRQLVDLVPVSMRRGVDFIEDRVRRGDPNFVLMFEFMGGTERFERRARWWDDHHDEFAAAMT
jgi:hypothetical protein